MKIAVPFYDKFLPLIGFDIESKVSAVIEEHDFIHGAKIVIQTLRGGSFRPNTLFLTIGEDSRKDNNISHLVEIGFKFIFWISGLHGTDIPGRNRNQQCHCPSGPDKDRTGGI